MNEITVQKLLCKALPCIKSCCQKSKVTLCMNDSYLKYDQYPQVPAYMRYKGQQPYTGLYVYEVLYDADIYGLINECNIQDIECVNCTDEYLLRVHKEFVADEVEKILASGFINVDMNTYPFVLSNGVAVCTIPEGVIATDSKEINISFRYADS